MPADFPIRGPHALQLTISMVLPQAFQFLSFRAIERSVPEEFCKGVYLHQVWVHYWLFYMHAMVACQLIQTVQIMTCFFNGPMWKKMVFISEPLVQLLTCVMWGQCYFFRIILATMGSDALCCSIWADILI